jgi:hypothetical protein
VPLTTKQQAIMSAEADEDAALNAPALTDDPVADALTALGILDGVDIDIASLRSAPRDEILSELRSAGVQKLGQRMKLLNLIQSSPASQPKPPPKPPLMTPQPAAVAPPPPPPQVTEPAPAAEPERTFHGLRRQPVPSPSSIPGLTPTNLSDGGAGWYEVVPNAVKVRSSPTTSADNVIAFLKQRKVFEAELEQNGWLRLRERSEPGAREQWVLMDGAALGLGTLVKRVPASARWRDDEDEKLEARVSDLMVEQWATDDL